MWTDTYVDAQDLFRLNDHQKISHYPAIEVLAKKNLLGRNLMKMKKIFPNDYHYFPSTWSLPSEYGDFMRYHDKLKA
jgi:tubulin polyglutamylase TTLL6/13